ncbi:MAG: hypothetical protein LUG46_00295 [Erysipelotrichaceae bacterium]|nr:hypothetical protein [Erysipelotrichaceae bacterium]
MKKRLSLIICIVLMVASLGGIGGTLYYATTSSTTSTMEMGEMPNTDSTSTDSSMPSGDISNDSSTPPDIPDGDSDSTQMPSDNTDDSSSVPDLPSDDSDLSEMPSDIPNSSDPAGQISMGQQMQSMGTTSDSLSVVEIVIISVCVVVFMLSLTYLIMSHMGKKTLKETFYGTKPTAIYAIVNVLGILFLVLAIVLGSNIFLLSNSSSNNMEIETTTVNSSGDSIDADAILEVTDTQTLDNQDLISTNEDENVVLVTDGGDLTLTNSTVTKESGDTSDTESSEFYGLNAAILVQEESTLSISDTDISTNAQGANGIFATGEGAFITVSNVTITTTEDSSRGLDATYGGTITADNVEISTSGSHCAAVATDRGEGTITVTNSVLNTAGKGSPSIYSTGNITVSDSTGTASDASCAVIEGKNSITINNTTLYAQGVGRTDDGIDNCGVMIYQSQSGDADEGTGTFTATDSTLTILEDSTVYDTTPMFFVTNTDAIINLENTTLNYGSGKLIVVSGNDGEWGSVGSNGGNLTFNATNQTLTGDISVDEYSTLSLVLKSSTLTGTINSDNTASQLDISLDSSSKWVVTGNSYITSLILEDEDDLSCIDDNGYTIYYDSDACSWLNGETITLQDGGTLTPIS